MMSGHATVDAAVRATRLGRDRLLGEAPVDRPAAFGRRKYIAPDSRRRRESARCARRPGSPESSSVRAARWRSYASRLRVRPRPTPVSSSPVSAVRARSSSPVAIHQASPRSQGSSREDQLRGRPWGSSSKASSSGTKPGRSPERPSSAAASSRRAAGGTIFLDEVGDMPLPMQAKLLRVLQEHEIEPRRRATRTFKIDVRVVAATNRDLVEAAKAGYFPGPTFMIVSMSSRLLFRLSEPAATTIRELVVKHFLAIASTANDRPNVTVVGRGSRRAHRVQLSWQRARAPQHHRAAGHLDPR